MSQKLSEMDLSTQADIVFAEVVGMIDTARQQAYQAVNTSLIALYWEVGASISAKFLAAEWGTGVVEQLARYLAVRQPGLRGFTRSNLFRMRQFYEIYRDNSNVASAQSWSQPRFR